MQMAKRMLYDTPSSSPNYKKARALSPADITTVDPHANVQAMITSVSPIKPSKFFDGELTDGETILRFVGFDKHQREELLRYSENGIPVTLKNCQVSQNKYNNKLEVILKNCTKLEKSDVSFNVSDPKTIGSPLINCPHYSNLIEQLFVILY